MYFIGVLVNKTEINTICSRWIVQDRFLERKYMYLLFNSDIVNLLLNTDGEKTEDLILIIFVVWNTLIVGPWAMVGLLVAWSRKSCLGPAEISSFVFLGFFKDGGRRVTLRFYDLIFWSWSKQLRNFAGGDE